MKLSIFLSFFSLLLMSNLAQATESPKPTKTSKTSEESGEIIFIRRTGYSGALNSFKAFIQEERVCRINNNRYSRHVVKPGTYKCSAQFYGKKRNVKRDQINIEIKPGEKKYVMLNLHYGLLVSKLSAVEISEDSAMNLLEKGIKLDPKY